MVAVGSRNLIAAKMMTYFCAIFTVLSLVTAANFSVMGVKKRLLTTFMVSVCATLRSNVLLGMLIFPKHYGPKIFCQPVSGNGIINTINIWCR